MENREFPQIDRILESIKASLKTELDSIKAELKTELKTEMASVKSELKAEIDSIKTGASVPPAAHEPPPPPGPPPPFNDFPESNMFHRESHKKTEEFTLRDFTGIEVGGAFEVEIVRSDSYSVSITAENELFRNLDVSKEQNTLRIRHSRHTGWRAQITRPKARITLPVLKELRLSGVTRGTVSGFSSSEAFKLSLSGASSLSGEMTTGDAELELSGATRVRLTGSAKDAVIEASGANHMELGDFSVHNAAVRLSGVSHCTLRMDGKLDARLSGHSHFGYIGNPMMGNIRTSGVSRLSKE